MVSIWEAIKDIEDEAGNTSEDIGGLYGHLLPLVPEGLNYSFLLKKWDILNHISRGDLNFMIFCIKQIETDHVGH